MRKIWFALLLTLTMSRAFADEGMWVLNELTEQNRARMAELGFTLPADRIYNEVDSCLANAVVIFGSGCTGITVSHQGLIFTNHHCGYGAIQQLSSVENDYLNNGFVSQTPAEELPVPGLTVRYLHRMTDVSHRINGPIAGIEDEYTRLAAADSIAKVLCDSIGEDHFLTADVIPFYSNNRYYLVQYDVYRDVRMVLAPPTSIGKFGGDTDNWMWPRHTGDFSVFRVYADAQNRPAEYNAQNQPYRPRYAAQVSLRGVEENDYAMTIGFPGSTSRYLCSWGVKQRMEAVNQPRIAVREAKQALWNEAMLASPAVRIKYASKYASSSNYWKNSIGMNRGLQKLDVIAAKKRQEDAFAQAVSRNPQLQTTYGNVLPMLEKNYIGTDEFRQALTVLTETFRQGAEIVRLARMVREANAKENTPQETDHFIEDFVRPFFKDYEPMLDQKVLAAMMQTAKSHLPDRFLPDIYKTIDRKYKGNYTKYAADLFHKTSLLSDQNIQKILKDPKLARRLENDPAVALARSVDAIILTIEQQMSAARYDILKAERLYLAGLKEIYPGRPLPSDANFTMRLSYGTVMGYRPYDAVWYQHFSTEKGVLEKEEPGNPEFEVQPAILNLLRGGNFGQYANQKGELPLCFLSNNDITGGNSGSPVFNGHGHLIGLAFDGNWEAMSGDIAFEHQLQRCIAVDIRYVLFLIDKWAEYPRLLRELTIVHPAGL